MFGGSDRLSGGVEECSFSGGAFRFSFLPSWGAFNCVFSVSGGAFNCNSISASASGGDFNCSLTVAEKSCEHLLLPSHDLSALALTAKAEVEAAGAEVAVVTAGEVARAGGFFDLKFIGIVRRRSRSMTASG